MAAINHRRQRAARIIATRLDISVEKMLEVQDQPLGDAHLSEIVKDLAFYMEQAIGFHDRTTARNLLDQF